MTHSPRPGSRTVGTVAGVAPALCIGLLFAASGSLAPDIDIAISLAAMALVSMAAGWAAGPFAASHGWVAGTCAYGASWILGLEALAMVQAAVDTWSTSGLDIGAILVTVVGRAAYGLISALYFLVPGLALGAVWIVVLRLIRHVGLTDAIAA